MSLTASSPTSSAPHTSPSDFSVHPDRLMMIRRGTLCLTHALATLARPEPYTCMGVSPLLTDPTSDSVPSRVSVEYLSGETETTTAPAPLTAWSRVFGSVMSAMTEATFPPLASTGSSRGVRYTGRTSTSLLAREATIWEPRLPPILASPPTPITATGPDRAGPPTAAAGPAALFTEAVEDADVAAAVAEDGGAARPRRAAPAITIASRRD
mmetsp:Transcript_18749/g.43274  ORF Transcript_18749/g.43274 Transcript_18749/m.43274 type:complete len:211 (-) Transcript_18749:241-873(-)